VKPLVKKILESGLVSKHAAKMLEFWGNLDPNSTELVDQKKLTEKNLEAFIEDIDQLLTERENVDLKETRLEVEVRPMPASLFSPRTGIIPAMIDTMGRYIVGPNEEFRLGQQVWPQDRHSLHPPAIITDIVVLYNEDVKYSMQITINDDDYIAWKALRRG
jgi:hypothetical protein